MRDDFRCSGASLDDAEPMSGTAPPETAWLLVEYAGSWGRQAVGESALPASVRDFLDGLGSRHDIRVQLIRRHGGATGPGIRVFAVRLDQQWIETTTLSSAEEVLDLDVAALAAGRSTGLTPYDGLLWLVCTNGKRDRCCAELGRPVARALAERWPEETWETNHLGGHRFAGTYVALPSGITVGRASAETAVSAASSIADGAHPLELSRGRAGFPGAVQVAELAWLSCGHQDVHWVSPATRDDNGAWSVTMRVDGDARVLRVHEGRAEPRRQSCADLKTKPAATFTVDSCGLAVTQ